MTGKWAKFNTFRDVSTENTSKLISCLEPKRRMKNKKLLKPFFFPRIYNLPQLGADDYTEFQLVQVT